MQGGSVARLRLMSPQIWHELHGKSTRVEKCSQAGYGQIHNMRVHHAEHTTVHHTLCTSVLFGLPSRELDTPR